MSVAGTPQAGQGAHQTKGKAHRSRKKEADLSLYLAALGGALVQAIVDKAFNDSQSVMARVGDKLLTDVMPSAFTRWFIAVIIMAIIATFLCWIFKPKNLKTAFYGGFSILAVLTVGFPIQVKNSVAAPNPQTSSSQQLEVKGLIWRVNDNILPWRYQVGTSIVEVSPKDEGRNISVMVITLRDIERQSIVAQQRFGGSKFNIDQPIGKYIVEIESPGYRITKSVIEVGPEPKRYRIAVDTSDVPISIQRLWAVDEEPAIDLGSTSQI